MNKTIEKLKKNGCVSVGGKEYILTEQATFTSDPVEDALNNWNLDNYYSARSICLDDIVDEDGYQKCYMVRWEILEDYNPDLEDEGCACNWTSPSKLKEFGEYNIEMSSYY